MLRLLVVEDHALVREGLVKTLHRLEAGVSVHEAADFESAKAQLDAHEFDLVLLDLGLPGVDGLSSLGIFRRHFPATPVVIVSAYDDALTVGRALKGGASGFVPKAYSGDRLLAALREVLDGRIYAPEQLLPANPGVDLPRPPVGRAARPVDFGLTDRQTDVLALMVRGKSNRDIAESLDLSEGTVKVHITAIFKALGVTSRTQALVAVARYKIRF